MDKRYNYGIDLFRIISMYMIVLLHIVGFSNIADFDVFNSNNYLLCNLIRGFTYCGVNCFALISGYVGIDSQFKISRLVANWIRVFWYAITLNIILSFFFDIDLYWWLTGFFPVSMTAYWYFTQYFRMFFLIPFMNCFVKKVPKKYSILCFAGILLYVFFNQDKVDRGYHFLWLSILYICGALIKKHNLFSSVKIRHSLLIYILSSLLTVFNYILYDIKVYEVNLEEYTSPTVFLAGISLLLVFSKIRINNKMKKYIKKLSPLVFSVYLFHTHPIFFMKVLRGCLEKYSECNLLISIILITFVSIFIYIISCIYEKIRVVIMNVFHVDSKIKKIDILINETLKKSDILKTIKLDQYFMW